MYYLVMEYPSDYLSHSGVKGMKWGVWNAETRARRSGYSEGKRLRKKYDIRSGPKDISKDYDKIDAAYKNALDDRGRKSPKNNDARTNKAYGEGLLSGLSGGADPRTVAKAEKANKKSAMAFQKLEGAALREANRPGIISTYKVNKAADKYVAARGKASILSKKAGKADDPYGIRKQERDAGRYLRNLNIAGVLGGSVGSGAYAVAARNKSTGKAYEAVRSRAIRDAREQAKYGKKVATALLNA